jgi:hypothetical protein
MTLRDRLGLVFYGRLFPESRMRTEQELFHYAGATGLCISFGNQWDNKRKYRLPPPGIWNSLQDYVKLFSRVGNGLHTRREAEHGSGETFQVLFWSHRAESNRRHPHYE